MNFVEPIRDRKRIAQIKNVLRGQGRYRDLLLFVVGINTALRISDLLQLRGGNFVDEAGRIKPRFLIREQKRDKRHHTQPIKRGRAWKFTTSICRDIGLDGHPLERICRRRGAGGGG
jgi:integrase